MKAAMKTRLHFNEVVTRDVPGQVAKTGRITDLHPAPESPSNAAPRDVRA